RLHAEEGGEALRQAALELREGLAKRFGLCVPDGSGGAASAGTGGLFLGTADGYCTDNLLFDIVYILLWM
ncbi:MAG: hypothetical protein LBB68_01745, partial [Treponema sp.]|nr:hypothetical protein [Treponema sp.]